MGDDPDSDDVPVAITFFIPPNQVLPHHTHDCHRVELVVTGTLDIGDRTLHPGDLATTAPGEFYGPHRAGPEGCLTVEIFSAARAMASRTPEGGRLTLTPPGD